MIAEIDEARKAVFTLSHCRNSLIETLLKGVGATASVHAPASMEIIHYLQ